MKLRQFNESEILMSKSSSDGYDLNYARLNPVFVFWTTSFTNGNSLSKVGPYGLNEPLFSLKGRRNITRLVNKSEKFSG